MSADFLASMVKWWYWWSGQPMLVRILVYLLIGYVIGSFIGGFISG